MNCSRKPNSFKVICFFLKTENHDFSRNKSNFFPIRAVGLLRRLKKETENKLKLFFEKSFEFQEKTNSLKTLQTS